MLDFERLQISLSILVANAPGQFCFVVIASYDFAAHFDFAAQSLRFFRACFPHHAWAFTRITKRIDQGLDDFRPVLRLPLRKERVLDRATERKTFNAL